MRTRKNAILKLTLSSLLALACTPVERPGRIVLVVVDTLRADAIAATPTPTLDALAARGQTFSNALASFHQTPMSMSAIFTGRTPSMESGEPSRSLRWLPSAWCGMARFEETPSQNVCLPSSIPTAGRRHMQRCRLACFSASV